MVSRQHSYLSHYRRTSVYTMISNYIRQYRKVWHTWANIPPVYEYIRFGLSPSCVIRSVHSSLRAVSNKEGLTNQWRAILE